MDRDRLKVLALGLRWPPETFIHRLLEALASQGIEVTAAAISRDKIALKPSASGPIRLIPLFSERQPLLWRIPIFTGLLFSKLFKNYHKICAFWKKTGYLKNFKKRLFFFFHRLLPIIGHDFDIIHFHWNSAAIDYLPFYELFNAGIIISCRGAQVNIAPHNPQRSDIVAGLRKTFEKADLIHCVSDAIMQEAHQYGLKQAKARVIRAGIDIDFFHPPEKKEVTGKGPVQIITVGSLIWRKGYEYALPAIRRLIDGGHNIIFKIICSGQAEKLSRMRVLFTIDDLGLDKSVELILGASPEEVRQRLWESDIFLLSSLSEGISNAALEAMACGLPVVTTDCGGMREAVTDGTEGLVAEVRDTQALAKALERLIKEPKLRQEMGQAGRERIVRDFTLKRQVEQFIQLYNAAGKLPA